jgi:hypothetical protein
VIALIFSSLAIFLRRYLRSKVRSGMLIICVVSAASMLVSEYLAVGPAPLGTLIPLFFLPFIAIASLGISVIYFIASILQAIFVAGNRLHYLRSAGLALLLVFVVCLGFFYTHVMRMHAFANLGQRFQPLIGAIKAYEKETGSPPSNLKLLQPKYIEKLPTSTDMGGYPNYEYQVFEDSDSKWELSVPCSSNPLNWDVCFYWPSQKYPDQIYGGSVERIDDWAYVHE